MLLSKRTINPLFALLAIGTVIIEANAQRRGRILGGRITTSNEFSAAAKLTVYEESAAYSCGAAIISRRHIVTAAHCVDTENITAIQVRAGTYDISDSHLAVDRYVATYFIHPEYIQQTTWRMVQNDIAVLVLESDLPMGPHITTYKLPTTPPNYKMSYKIAGWGLPGLNATTIENRLKTLTMKLCPPNVYKPHTLCAEPDSGATCAGDSGSPLVSNGRVYGLVSTGSCLTGRQTTFSDVYSHRDWITNVIKENPY